MATLFRDVHSASFGATTIPETSEVQIEIGGRPVSRAADTDAWISHVDLVERVAVIELVTADVEVVLKDLAVQMPITGTLQFTVAAAGGGQDLSFTITNAVLVEAGARVRHGKVASDARLRFVAYSPDGAASPVTITPV